ncbi:RNA ligase (ATP) [Chitinophaga oryzae]|uniref:RNA ligase (ATP) n=1 Tax=Chitinophaga oryzae TaxID=2725414 RepID=A0AAE6ZFG9_9BACT|nr:RNA ligase (ATP) [Chitinophaga oryzae]QJB32030.1 RNA ligase (ATP) [Chitinophaga oryzae]QJB38507.1 RNA ligase (ATP) [Chitinophaga oryzae]
MERKLASVVVIDDLQPIPGADLIAVATVKGWKLVVKKEEFRIGDLAVYCEIDAFLPEKPEFEFLRKSSFRKMGEQNGFRLKTMKLRGQISQGLLLPVTVLNGYAYTLGEDVSARLGIVKYEPPVPASLAGMAKGSFPSFIPKTDEERIQNLSAEYDAYKKESFYVTEKLDGSSATFYYRDGDFGVCSRNLDLLETGNNTFWKIARQLELPAKMASLGKNMALQGELIGEGIQGNPYGIKGQTVRFFNAFDIDAYAYLTLPALREMTGQLGLELVPVLDTAFTLPDTVDQLLLAAEGASALSPAGKHVEREGLVVRSADKRISFKVISNKFLLNEK